MRKDFGSKPMLYPMPVLIIGTYDEDGTPNAMNAAWGGIVDTNLIGICLADHKTTRNIFARKAFVSGDKVPDKVARAGWHTSKSHLVDAPIIDELPMTLECSFVSYDEGTGLLIGRIENVSAEESILTDGKIDLNKFHPITFDPCGNGYYPLGEKLGDAFQEGIKLK